MGELNISEDRRSESSKLPRAELSRSVQKGVFQSAPTIRRVDSSGAWAALADRAAVLCTSHAAGTPPSRKRYHSKQCGPVRVCVEYGGWIV